MRKILRKNRRDRSRGGKKRRVMYKQDFMLRGCPLSALRATLPKGESKGVSKAKLKKQTISDSPLRNRRSLPEGESKEAVIF